MSNSFFIGCKKDGGEIEWSEIPNVESITETINGRTTEFDLAESAKTWEFTVEVAATDEAVAFVESLRNRLLDE